MIGKINQLQYIINIALYEISSHEFYYENYKNKNNNIKIVNYKKANANKTEMNYIIAFKEELKDWFYINSKSKNVINIVI